MEASLVFAIADVHFHRHQEDNVSLKVSGHDVKPSVHPRGAQDDRFVLGRVRAAKLGVGAAHLSARCELNSQHIPSQNDVRDRARGLSGRFRSPL